jgi:hypothetical protein
MTRAAIKTSPEWAIDEPINRAFEEQLSRHYGRMPLRRKSDRLATKSIAP